MFDALQIAATGMQAQQQNVDTIANNLANVNTTGFKKSRVSFSDLVTRGAESATVAIDIDPPLPGGAQRLSAGVSVGTIGKLFDPGDIRKTEMPMDVAIAGAGFFEVAMPDGSSAYSRGGSLKVNPDGQLATHGGHALKPGLNVPDNAQEVVIAADGKVYARLPDRVSPVEVGQLDMVRFTSPETLTALGDGLYRTSDASGEPIAGRAGEDAMGTVRQGYIEASNVKLVEEMVNLMLAQRAYEASVKVVQASDEMLGMVNSLRR